MKWFLEFSPPKAPFEIEYHDKIFSLGSCFSENITQKMLGIGWKGESNPFGLLYNPDSILEAVKWIEAGDVDSSEFFEHRGLWRHWLCHSSLASGSKEQAIQNVENALIQGREAWEEADVLILTLGSAYSWFHVDLDKTVSNCHQMPKGLFAREFLGIDQMFAKLTSVLQKFRNGKARRRIVLTVSPVRYLRDGLIASNRSKARLIEAAHQISEQMEGVYYFPAYEIVIDQLRDYRFFAEDMVHPSEEAVAFVWEQFQEIFTQATKAFVQEALRIERMFRHRILNPESPEGLAFVEKREAERLRFEKRFGLRLSTK